MKVVTKPSLIHSFSKDTRGVTLVEYAIALFLMITVGVLGLTDLGTAVSDNMDDTEQLL